MTNIRVRTDVRDLLKAQARARGRTLGEHLQDLADRENHRQRMQEMKEAMQANPPDQEYFAELAEWEGS
ncbi:MAG: hypothetical protein Q4G64_09350 [bacterium]|nr:hypothetical protein [bacterium]